MGSSGKAAGRVQSARGRDRFVGTATALCLSALMLCCAAAAWAQPTYALRDVASEDVFAGSPASYALKGITLEDAPGEFTVIFWTDPPVKAYHYAFPRNPARLAIDLPGKWKKLDKRLYRQENDTVSRITVTRHPDRLRATLHLKTQQIFEPFIYDSIKGLIFTIKKAHLFMKPLPEGVKATAAASQAAVDGMLTDLSVEALPDGFRLTVSLDQAHAGYNIFRILDEHPPKLVLDLNGVWRNPGETVREVENDAVQRLRVGEHPAYLRIVMDLAFEGKPVVEATAEGEKIVLDVRRPST